MKQIQHPEINKIPLTYPESVIYEREVNDWARDMIQEWYDPILDGLIKGTRTIDEIEPLDEGLREKEFYFNLEDAAFVIQNSKNVEEDYGLWQGKEPVDAVIIQGVYTAQNDLYLRAEEYIGEAAESLPELDSLNHAKESLDQVLIEHTPYQPPVIQSGSYEELRQLEIWHRESVKVGLRGGYPLGHSYIDIRCGYQFAGDRWYINFDHEVGRRLPQWSGKYASDISTMIE